MTDNFYKSEIDRELLLNIEIQKQNLKSLPAKFKPQKKVVSIVTKQMIEDYKQQFRNAYKRTDEKGTSKFFKFLIPEALPVLEETDRKKLLEEGKLRPEFTVDIIKKKLIDVNLADDDAPDITIDDIKDRIKYLVEIEIPDQERGLKDQYRIIEESKQKINELTERRFIRSRYKEEVKDIDRKIDNEIERRKKSEDAIPIINIRLKNIHSSIDDFNRIIDENEGNKLFNDNYLYTIEQNNNKKLAEYAETVKRLNEGQIDLTRGQYESEQDYLKRLSDVALIEEDLTIIHLFNNNEFKKNLKPIVGSEWKIENISKAFDDDSKFLFNKTFARFKIFFKDKYGLGNKNLDVDEYVSLITNYLDQVDLTKYEKPIIPPGEASEPPPRKEASDSIEFPQPGKVENLVDLGLLPGEEPPGDNQESSSEPPPGTDDDQGSSSEPPPGDNQESSKGILSGKINDNEIVIINTDIDGIIYFKINDKNQIAISGDGENYGSIDKSSRLTTFEAKTRDILTMTIGKDSANFIINDCRAYSGNSKEVISKNKFITYIKEILANPKNTKDELDKVSKKIKEERKENAKLKKERLDKRYAMYEPSDSKTGEGLRKSKKSKRKKIVAQKGASIKAIPKHVEFGKLILLLNKLVNQNILSIKDSNGINIPGLPNQKVSDKFVQLIQKIVSDEDITLKEVDDLNEKDSILYTVIMNKAGLKRKFNVNNVRALEALKNRLELVEGELEAGNDNKDIVKELYEIGYKLAYLGAIKVSEAKIHYKQTIDLLKNN
jgi:hypothetical protein